MYKLKRFYSIIIAVIISVSTVTAQENREASETTEEVYIVCGGIDIGPLSETAKKFNKLQKLIVLEYLKEMLESKNKKYNSDYKKN